MQAYSERYEAALILAARAHRTQLRKVGDVPYIVHPVHVSAILLRHGFSEDVVIAGLLHDVIEDQDVSLECIKADFGPTIAEIVVALTERKKEGGVDHPWEARKQELREQVRRASPEAVAVRAADTLHSARCLASDLRREGPCIWSRFSRGPGPSLGHYRRVAAVVRERLGAHPLASELDDAVGDLARAIAETESN